MSIDLEIAATDEFSQMADKAAKALTRIAAEEKQILDLSNKLGKTEQETARAVALVAKEKKEVERAAVRAAKAEEREKKKVERAESKAQREREKAHRENEKANKDQIEALGKVAKGAALAATAIAAGAAAAAALVTGLIGAAAEAGRAARNAEALMHGMTGGRGAQALELVDHLAEQLGIRFDDAREQFGRFREAGLDNRMSANLIKMRADLIAFGLSAEAADREVDRVLNARGSGAQSRALAEISAAYDGVGSGALSAERAATSADGAMNRISNIATEQLEAFWERIGPHIDTAATALADFLEFFVETPEAQAALTALADGFTFVATTSASAVRLIRNDWQGFKDSISEVGKSMLTSLLGPFGFIVPLIDGSAAEAAAASSRWGSNVVDGFSRGIDRRAAAASASVRAFARSVSSAFTSALGIHSPSRLFEEYGGYTVEGFERGQEREIPDHFPLEERAEAPAIPINQLSANSPAAQTAAPQQGSNGPLVQIDQLIVQSGTDDPEEIARAVRREIGLLLSAQRLSRGN